MAPQETPVPLHLGGNKTLTMLLRRLDQTGGEKPADQLSMEERKLLKRAIACGETRIAKFITLHQNTKDIPPQTKALALYLNYIFNEIRLGNADIIRAQAPNRFDLAESYKADLIGTLSQSTNPVKPNPSVDVPHVPNPHDRVSGNPGLKEHFKDIYVQGDADKIAILLKNIASVGGPLALTDRRFTKPIKQALALAYHQGTRKQPLAFPLSPGNKDEAPLYHEAALMHFFGNVMSRAREYVNIDYLRHIMPPDQAELYIGTFENSRMKHFAESTRKNYPTLEIFESVF